ncbi:TPA: KAP family P-loop NTPase fold protein [Stenotrophomonas maltophilia]
MSNYSLSKFQSPSIDPKNPWMDDVLERKPFGETIASMIRGINQPYVISLKGDWGSGKSVFLRRIQASLEITPRQTPVIFVDAWKHDYYEDPLYALVSAIEERLIEHENSNGGNGQSAVELAKQMFASAGRVIAPLAKITGGAIDLVTGGAVSDIAEGVGELGAALRQANLDKRDAHENLTEQFRSARDNLLGRNNEDLARPWREEKVVVIIDELDRCRPDYAIRLLERVKHYFDLPGYIFLIAIDGENLHSAVRSLYGPTADGEKYLRKFFDLELYLPAPNSIKFNRLLRSSFEVGADETKWNNQLQQIADDSSSFHFSKFSLIEASAHFEMIATALNLRLRDQAQAFARLHAATAAFGRNSSFIPVATAFITCLRHTYEAWRTRGVVPEPDESPYVSLVHQQSRITADSLYTYLTLARFKTVDEFKQAINFTSRDSQLDTLIQRRLPSNLNSWPALFKSSHRDIFTLSRMTD